MFNRVSFGLLSMYLPIPTTIVGGLAETALKKENGARLCTPFDDLVDMKAIGLGATIPVSM